MGDIGVSAGSEISAARQMAARLAGMTDIRDVRLMRSCAEVMRLPIANPFLAYNLDFESAVEYEPGGESFVVRGTYRLSITSASTAEAKNAPPQSDDPVAKIEFEQAALFVIDMEGQEPPKAEELNAYAVSTGQFALYPYVREYISDITSRLGLPPLTVGVLRMPIANSEQDRK
jgi:hypothetical protein